MKRIISLILTLVMIFSFAVVASAYEESVLKTVFDATKLLGNETSYKKDAKITYAELAVAGLNIFKDEGLTAYVENNAQRPFEHLFAKEF